MKTSRFLTWKRFLQIAKPFWRGEERWKARGLLVLLILLLLGYTEFSVLFNEQSGEFTSALAAKDGARFWHTIYVFVAMLVVAVPINAFYYYVRDKLGIRWRRWLTRYYLDRYFADRAFYKLGSNESVDNPDQRISEDISTFTQKSLNFSLIILGAVIQLVAFSRVLWSISHLLVGILVVYAAAGTLITTFGFGRVLVGLNFLQLKREADFRFGLIRVRENAEAIAFYRGEQRESSRVKQRFKSVFKNFSKLIHWQLKLNLFQYAYSFSTYVIPAVVMAPVVISGESEVGVVVQAAGAFAAMLSALTVFIDNFDSLSKFVAGIDRLDTFAIALSPPKRGAASGIRTVEAPQLALKNVTVMTPGSERTLVKNLSLQVEPGRGLMIMGPSGGGKSSLLRAIAGLWTDGSGTVFRPGTDNILFLPQHPYMTLGTLRSQLLYPQVKRELPDEELHRILQAVNLPDVVSRLGGLDVELDWSKVLSLGEQQRLAFARVMLTKPRYAILDEATSALDEENEVCLYGRLQDSSTTLVSVSHRVAILKYHDRVLELMGDGEWRLRPASELCLPTVPSLPVPAANDQARPYA